MYKFKSEDAESFARSIGAYTKRKTGQLEFMECPYCRSKKDKYTFGISLTTGQFECKRSSCGVKGNMITLSKDFNFSLGSEVDAYYKSASYTKKNYKTFADSHKAIKVRQGAIEYLKNRGIDEGIIQKYEITTKPDDENIIVFPFKDETGALQFIKYRNAAFVKGVTSGSKEYCESNCKPILFGMNHCDSEKNKTLIITEGQIDSLSVATANFDNVVSVPTGCKGFTWVPYCWDFVSKFDRIIVMGDHENGKITLVEDLAKRWPEKIRIVKEEDYKDCKDANELLLKYGVSAIKQAIENAEAPNNKHIKSLADVQMVDIMNVEKISTGMKKLDEILDGGFRFGQLAVLTGKRGEGKSTIASMWGVNAIDQNYNCYFYSGELPDFFFKNWMDCQITGKKDHTVSEDEMLCNWYRDKAFIYDDTTAGDDEYCSIIDAVQIAIVQRNCKFILIDNLMTAIEDDLSSDLYRNQSKFVGELAAMSKKYNVFILLIAHPRKEMWKDKLDNDSISGSSHITDKADIVIAYGKKSFKKKKKDEDGGPEEIEEESEGVDETGTLRELAVLKNRLTGKLTPINKPIQLTYDLNSRRVADDTKALFGIKFDWNTGLQNIDDLEIPF